MAKWRWMVPLAALGGLAALDWWRGGRLRQLGENMQQFDLPNAASYDRMAGRLMMGLYRCIATDLAAMHPSGVVMDIGSGPGYMPILLAQKVSSLRIFGVDVAPDMVEIANRKAAEAGVAERVSFEVGDVGALRAPDGQMDMVTSTLSLHHWPDPAQGLREIHRVLKPGGRAIIYDIGPWVQRLDWLWSHRHNQPVFDLPALAAASPFGGGETTAVRWPGPLPAIRRIVMMRSDASDLTSRMQ